VRRIRAILAVALAAGTLVAIAPAPAQALHYATNCEDIRKAGTIDTFAKACAILNRKDPISVTQEIEGLADYRKGPNTAEVQFDWVHLYRWPQGTDGQDELYRATGGPSGWLSEGGSYSTNWGQHHCGWAYQTRIRWRVRWGDGSVSDYLRTRSDVKNWC
jgi:hypothetical protein